MADQLVSPRRYDNSHDIEQALMGAWFFYDEMPIRVNQINGQSSVIVSTWKIDSGASALTTFDTKYHRCIPVSMDKVINVNSVKLDLRNKRLGYINCNNSASYIVRGSHRQWRRGLHSRNVLLYTPEGIPNQLNYIPEPYVAQFMFNDYPPYPIVLDYLLNSCPSAEKIGHNSSFAFHRDCALLKTTQGDIELYYKNRLAGLFNPKKQAFVLMPLFDMSLFHRILIEQGVKIDYA